MNCRISPHIHDILTIFMIFSQILTWVLTGKIRLVHTMSGKERITEELNGKERITEVLNLIVVFERLSIQKNIVKSLNPQMGTSDHAHERNSCRARSMALRQ